MLSAFDTVELWMMGRFSMRIQVFLSNEMSYQDAIYTSGTTEGPLLEFEVGSGRVIKGFDEAVRGLSIGESREVW